MEVNDVSQAIIGAAIEVHRCLGPGLLESAYEVALAHQLRLNGLTAVRQQQLAVRYKGMELQDAYRIDLLVEDQVIVEVKAVENLLPIHTAQLLTYLRFASKPLGLLVNFNSKILHRGVQRVANSSI